MVIPSKGEYVCVYMHACLGCNNSSMKVQILCRISVCVTLNATYRTTYLGKQ